MTKASDNEYPSVLFDEQGSDPSTPASGFWRAYMKSGGLFIIDDGGTVTGPLGTGGGGGDLVLLEQHTASNQASLDFTTFISSTYDEYMIDGVDLTCANNNVGLTCQVGTGGGPTYDTGSNYVYMVDGRTSGDADYHAAGTAAAMYLAFSQSNDSTTGFCSFSTRWTNLQSTSRVKSFHGTGVERNNTPAYAVLNQAGIWVTSGTAVTALRFLYETGNILSGTIRAYGIAK